MQKRFSLSASDQVRENLPLQSNLVAKLVLCISPLDAAWKKHKSAPRNEEDIGKMGNLKVTMTDVNGVTKTFENVEEGMSLMELGKQNGVAGIMGDCGGGCACATCQALIHTSPSKMTAR